MSERKGNATPPTSPQGEETSSPSEARRELFKDTSVNADDVVKELTILVKITKSNGEPLPPGTVNSDLITEMFQNAVGVLPLEIEVLGSIDALVDLPLGAAVYEIAQCMQGPWEMAGPRHQSRVYFGVQTIPHGHLQGARGTPEAKDGDKTAEGRAPDSGNSPLSKP